MKAVKTAMVSLASHFPTPQNDKGKWTLQISACFTTKIVATSRNAGIIMHVPNVEMSTGMLMPSSARTDCYPIGSSGLQGGSQALLTH